MTAEQFAYWMQGFAELNAGPPDEAQWQSIREHLKTVFVKVTPGMPSAPHVPTPDIATPGGVPDWFVKSTVPQHPADESRRFRSTSVEC